MDCEVDDAKCIVDLEHARNMKCRNSDGIIPANTIRIITTNHDWQRFWPAECFMPDHLDAIKRRVVWMKLDKPCIRSGVQRSTSEPAASTEAAEPTASTEAAPGPETEDETQPCLPVDEGLPDMDCQEDPFDFGFDIE